MLKITKSTEAIEVKDIILVIYSPPGLGKTSTAFTAEKPLLLDFDKGAYRSANRRDVVQVESWTDVTAITAEDLAPYRTVVVDTAGRALDVLAAHILKTNPKAGNRAGGLSLPGYGELKTVFIGWMKLIRSFGLDVILLSHSDEQRNGDDVIERLDIQGGSKNEIYKAADVMGRLGLVSGKRTLNFSPTDTSFGKNPAQLAPIQVPDFATTGNFLETVIHSIKASLNKASAEQTTAATLLAEWKAKVDAVSTIDELNALIPVANEVDARVRENVKRLITKTAKDAGYVFDKAAKAFTAGKAAA